MTRTAPLKTFFNGGSTLVKRVAVITHRRPDKTGDALNRVLKLCRDHSVEVVVPEREAEKHSLKKTGTAATVVSSLKETEVTMCIALGGDGTILRAFNRLKNRQTPVLGINFGRIGFLAALGPAAIPEKLGAVLMGDYSVMEMCMLDLELEGGKFHAVNDVVFQKPDGASVVNLGYEINGIEMDSYQCDGLVAATPAGSTAYNLSNGGPLASLELDLMVLTAIAPHCLRSRAVILGEREKLTVTNSSLGVSAAVYVDGQKIGGMESAESATVTISDLKARLVRTAETDFYRSLRDKFINK